MRERARARWRRRLRHSLRGRLVALFVLLALGITAALLYGMQRALVTGWREGARPLVTDYVDRLVADLGTPPDPRRAQALVQRLPVSVRIEGPLVHWQSHPGQASAPWRDEGRPGDAVLLTRTTADGHRVTLGLSARPWHDRPRRVGFITLAVVLVLTAVAYGAVRRLLRPLDDIRAGAQRFGRGEFGDAIPIRRRDELGDLAGDVNAMAAGIHQMLEAKRGLLLAISHELRSPLTRARLNTELLAEEGETGARRAALLRDLQEMADLVSDLLESERLGQGHAALHREPTDLAGLVQDALRDLPVRLQLPQGLPPVPVDRMRLRLLLRNLADNALRHGAGAEPPVVTLVDEGATVRLVVRDHGPGVAAADLARLAEPFYRPDASRGRATGGVGLGLYLCRLVAQAHGGSLALRPARPGLEVGVVLPAA